MPANCCAAPRHSGGRDSTCTARTTPANTTVAASVAIKRGWCRMYRCARLANRVGSGAGRATSAAATRPATATADGGRRAGSASTHSAISRNNSASAAPAPGCGSTRFSRVPSAVQVGRAPVNTSCMIMPN